jgi:hypothetical protein
MLAGVGQPPRSIISSALRHRPKGTRRAPTEPSAGSAGYPRSLSNVSRLLPSVISRMTKSAFQNPAGSGDTSLQRWHILGPRRRGD